MKSPGRIVPDIGILSYHHHPQLEAIWYAQYNTQNILCQQQLFYRFYDLSKMK
jgi:hypothetical protein